MKAYMKETIDLKEKELFIFDFDGTIADTSHAHETAFCETLHAFDPCINFDYTLYKGMTTKEAFKKIMNDQDLVLKREDLQSLISMKQTLSKKMLKTSVNLLPQFKEFISLLGDKKKCIVSMASKDSIEIVLDSFSINCFDFIVSSEDVTYSKPHPEGFLKALEYFKIPAHESVIFEDSENGFLAASKANIEFININETSWKNLHDECKRFYAT